MEEKRVILYSTGCPKCQILTKMLNKSDLSYAVETDPEVMISLGMTSVPCLEVGHVVMDFSTAVQWLRDRDK